MVGTLIQAICSDLRKFQQINVDGSDQESQLVSQLGYQSNQGQELLLPSFSFSLSLSLCFCFGLGCIWVLGYGRKITKHGRNYHLEGGVEQLVDQVSPWCRNQGENGPEVRAEGNWTTLEEDSERRNGCQLCEATVDGLGDLWS